jgi:hypothetical protein
MSPHETHRRRSQETCVGAPSEGWAKKAAAVAHGGPWESREAPVPSARLHGVGCQVEVNNDKALVRPSIDAFEGEPGHPPDLHLLFLHPTLLNPRWLDDSMRTLTLSLPLLNPIASCDSRQDEDGVCDTTRPLNQRSMSARKREEQQAEKQVDQQRSEFAPDLRFMDGLEEDFVLDGALMVVMLRHIPLGPRTVAMDACARSSHGGRRFQPQRLGPRAGFLTVPASSRRSASRWSFCLRPFVRAPTATGRTRGHRGCSQRRE